MIFFLFFPRKQDSAFHANWEMWNPVFFFFFFLGGGGGGWVGGGGGEEDKN